MDRIGFFLATEKGYFCLKECVKNGYSKNIGFVVSFKEVNVKKSFDADIKKICKEKKVPFFEWKSVKNCIIAECERLKISIAFAIGWRFLIPTEINDVLKFGLIIFHDSLLPKYRGFAPTPTAIMCGERKVGVTALVAAESVDKGDIILQRELIVEDDDYICDVIRKQSKVYAEMLMEILTQIKCRKLDRRIQDEKGVYSIWRDIEDCKINWELSAVEIRNMVRAVSSPYPGAYCYYKKKRIILNKVEVVNDLNFAIRQCGKIWSITENMPTVICGTGMLKIVNAEYTDGQLVIFDKLRERL